VLCIWDAFVDNLQYLLRILWKKITFLVKNKIQNRIYKNGHAWFPAEHTSHLAGLNVQVNREKNRNKKYSKPCQVQPILLSLWACGSPTNMLSVYLLKFTTFEFRLR